MADGRVVIEAQVDDDGVSRGIRAIKSKLRELDSGLIRTAALASAITIAPAAVPALAAVTGGVMALGSSFAVAGIGATAFGAVAVGALTNIFDAAEEVQKLEEKIANADSLKEKIKAQKELAELYNSMSEAQRNALKELQAFKSFWSDFAKQFETPVFEAFANVLKGTKTLLQGLAPTIKNVADVVVELTNEFNQALQSSSMKGFFEWLETNAAESIYNFAHIFGNVFMGVMNLLQAFSPLGASIEEGLVRLTERFREWSASLSQSAGFQQFVEYVKENGATLLNILGNVVKTIGELVIALAPVGSAILNIIDAVTSFIAKLAEALNSSETFKNGVTTIFNTIKTVVLQVFGAVRDFVLQKAEEIRTFWQQNGEQIRQATEKIFQFIQKVVSVTMPIVLGIIKSVWENIKGVISGAIKIILGIIKTFSALLTGDWKGVWEGIKMILKGAVQFIWNAIQLGFMGKIFGVIRDFAGKAIDKIVEMAEKFKRKFGEILSTAKSKFESVKNAIMEPIRKAKDFVKEQVDKIVGFFRNMKISFPKIKLPHFSISGKFSLMPPSVPKISVDWYKKGGLFPANSPQIIGIGDASVPEAALPLSPRVLGMIGDRIAQHMPQMATRGQHITIETPIYLDGYEIARGTFKYNEMLQGNAFASKLRISGVRV
jgi:phage-related protein